MYIHFHLFSKLLTVVGQWITKSFVPWCRHGLLAYVYNGVSLTRMSLCVALVAGNGSYIVWPCGHDLHGPTSSFFHPFFEPVLASA